MKKTRSHYLVDLFAGCGGLSLGLENAGFHPVFVNELNNNARASYLANRKFIEPRLEKPNFHCSDVKELVLEPDRISRLIIDLKKEYGLSIEDGELDLLVGGPPCQGFSGIGYRRSYSVDKGQLPSNHLYQDMAWVVNKLRPKIFLFENVRGLLTAKWTDSGTKGEIWQDVLATFRNLEGYKVESSLVFAKDYGVPQNRPRVLLVGVREDINTAPWMVESSNVAGGFLPNPTVGSSPDLIDLLGDLVDHSFSNGGSSPIYTCDPQNSIQRELRRRPDGTIAMKGEPLLEQEYSYHSAHVQEKFNYMLENSGKIPEHLQTKKFAQRLLPARWPENGPSITATSLPDDYVHFSQPRTLTVREWARLQGFPDWYVFHGSRTTGGLRRAGNPRDGSFDRELPKYTQIGNAVPANLAKEVGLHFKKLLSGDEKGKRNARTTRHTSSTCR